MPTSAKLKQPRRAAVDVERRIVPPETYHNEGIECPTKTIGVPCHRCHICVEQQKFNKKGSDLKGASQHLKETQKGKCLTCILNNRPCNGYYLHYKHGKEGGEYKCDCCMRGINRTCYWRYLQHNVSTHEDAKRVYGGTTNNNNTQVARAERQKDKQLAGESGSDWHKNLTWTEKKGIAAIRKQATLRKFRPNLFRTVMARKALGDGPQIPPDAELTEHDRGLIELIRLREQAELIVNMGEIERVERSAEQHKDDEDLEDDFVDQYTKVIEAFWQVFEQANIHIKSNPSRKLDRYTHQFQVARMWKDQQEHHEETFWNLVNQHIQTYHDAIVQSMQPVFKN